MTKKCETINPNSEFVFVYENTRSEWDGEVPRTGLTLILKETEREGAVAMRGGTLDDRRTSAPEPAAAVAAEPTCIGWRKIRRGRI